MSEINNTPEFQIGQKVCVIPVTNAYSAVHYHPFGSTIYANQIAEVIAINEWQVALRVLSDGHLAVVIKSEIEAIK